jgi:hypothetical protein
MIDVEQIIQFIVNQSLSDHYVICLVWKNFKEVLMIAD